MPLNEDESLDEREQRLVAVLHEQSVAPIEDVIDVLDEINSQSGARNVIAQAREKGLGVEYDREAGGYALAAGEQQARSLSTKHKGTITRELNSWAEEQDSVVLRRLERYDPIRAQQNPSLGGYDVCLFLSDYHFGDSHERDVPGGSTVTYDAEQGKRDMRHVGEHVIRRYADDPDVDAVHICPLGDFVTGEDVYEKQAWQVEKQIIGQMDDAVAALRDLIFSFRSEFDDDVTMTVNCVPGNHGRAGSHKSPSSNFDLIAYRWVQDRVAEAGLENISWREAETSPFLTVPIRNGDGCAKWRLHLQHGQDGQEHVDKTAASKRDWRGWRDAYKFDFAARGHFHNYGFDKVMNCYPVITLPSPKPGDDFAARIGNPDVSVSRGLGAVAEIGDRGRKRRVEEINDAWLDETPIAGIETLA